MESNTNPTGKTQWDPLQIHEFSYSETLTEQKRNSSVELQEELPESFSIEQNQAEIERLKMQHQKRIKAATQLSGNQGLERNWLLQQLNQLDTVVQDDFAKLERTESIRSPSEKVLSQQDLDFEYLICSFFMLLQKCKKSINSDAISFAENLVYNSKKPMPSEKHCIDFHSIPLISEYHDLCFYYILSETNFVDKLWTVVLNPVKNITTAGFWKTINPRRYCSPIQDVLVHFLNKPQEATELLEQPIVVSSAIDELREKQLVFDPFEDKVKISKNPNS